MQIQYTKNLISERFDLGYNIELAEQVYRERVHDLGKKGGDRQIYACI